MCRYFFLFTKFIIVKDERGMLDVFFFNNLYFTYQTRQDHVTITCVTANTTNIHHIYTNAQEEQLQQIQI